jgi:hypothetical protein
MGEFFFLETEGGLKVADSERADTSLSCLARGDNAGSDPSALAIGDILMDDAFLGESMRPISVFLR